MLEAVGLDRNVLRVSNKLDQVTVHARTWRKEAARHSKTRCADGGLNPSCKAQFGGTMANFLGTEGAPTTNVMT